MVNPVPHYFFRATMSGIRSERCAGFALTIMRRAPHPKSKISTSPPVRESGQKMEGEVFLLQVLRFTSPPVREGGQTKKGEVETCPL